LLLLLLLLLLSLLPVVVVVVLMLALPSHDDGFVYRRAADAHHILGTQLHEPVTDVAQGLMVSGTWCCTSM
jgi:hypothetical protein